MKLNTQKKLAGKVSKASPKRVKLDPTRYEEIKESITKADIRSMIKDGAIKVIQKKGISRVRANKIKVQKSKGRRKGPGKMKGKKTARAPKKITWMNKIRLQRKLLRALKDGGKIDTEIYRQLYLKSKGGFFRSKRHLKLYLEDNKLIK